MVVKPETHRACDALMRETDKGCFATRKPIVVTAVLLNRLVKRVFRAGHADRLREMHDALTELMDSFVPRDEQPIVARVRVAEKTTHSRRHDYVTGR